MKSKLNQFAIVDSNDYIIWTYPTLKAAQSDFKKWTEAQTFDHHIKFIPDMKASKREPNHLA